MIRYSVSIATWNRADLLRQTLESLLTVRVPAGVTFELLVCDNNSSDDTQAAVASFEGRFERAFADRFAGPVRYLFEPAQGKSHALNRLVAEAKGEWVLFADDDVLIDPGWFEAYERAAARYPRAGVLGGAMDPWLSREPGRRQRFLLQSYPAVFALIDLREDTPIDAEAGWAAGANMALLHSAIPAEGFDTGLGPKVGDPVNGEDAKMVRQVLASGYEGWMLAEARVRHFVHPHRLTMRYLWHWQRFIGQGWVRRRGKPQPGKLGVPWWAWREFARRALRAAVRWRPWPDRRFYDAVVEAAQYWGYLRAK
jgi:glucosyl-dolichyl phosphate glucuronosyltransferase